MPKDPPTTNRQLAAQLGGYARRDKLSPERRKEIAIKGAQTRWEKKKRRESDDDTTSRSDQ